jgi:hypothetical protein
MQIIQSKAASQINSSVVLSDRPLPMPALFWTAQTNREREWSVLTDGCSPRKGSFLK